jgi:hypothetical protein
MRLFTFLLRAKHTASGKIEDLLFVQHRACLLLEFFHSPIQLTVPLQGAADDGHILQAPGEKFFFISPTRTYCTAFAV